MACSDKTTQTPQDQWPLRIVLSQFWLGLQNKNKRTWQTKYFCCVFPTKQPLKPLFNLNPVWDLRIGVSWKQWSRWARPYFCLHKHKARDGKRHPQHYSFWWTTTSYPGSTSQAERAADQPGFFSGSQQAERHKAKGKLQWGRQRKEVEELKLLGQREEQHGNSKRITAVPRSRRLLIETTRSPTHSPPIFFFFLAPVLMELFVCFSNKNTQGGEENRLESQFF